MKLSTSRFAHGSSDSYRLIEDMTLISIPRAKNRTTSSVGTPFDSTSSTSRPNPRRTTSRRSSAVLRSFVAAFTARKLALTHNACQALRDPVEIGVGQSRVERQRQRALEGLVGPRERPLVGVRREAVERVGADLRLDSLRAQLVENVVAPLHLDHVGLPAVAV